MKSILNQGHQNIFNQKPDSYYFAPGRVNLIGEHVDYSGGHVLPMALNIGTYASVSKRNDLQFQVYSENYASIGLKVIYISNLAYQKEDRFVSYIKGMIVKSLKRNFTFPFGLNIYIKGNMPTSAGLSSSASLELLIATIFKDIYGWEITTLEQVHDAKYVENVYLGLSSGIMDQFAVAFGKKDHALFLNTKTLVYEHVPFILNDYALVLMNTNKSRNLIESNYNDRVLAIEKGFELFNHLLGVEALCDVTKDQFDSHQHIIEDTDVFKRVKHVVYENLRTIEAYQALKELDMMSFGKLMTESHISLKSFFEVSCDELDFLVDEHLSNGALGARMTGAGFGGTMIALYKKENLPKNFDAIEKAYANKFHRKLDIITSDADDGARALKGDF